MEQRSNIEIILGFDTLEQDLDLGRQEIVTRSYLHDPILCPLRLCNTAEGNRAKEGNLDRWIIASIVGYKDGKSIWSVLQDLRIPDERKPFQNRGALQLALGEEIEVDRCAVPQTQRNCGSSIERKS